MSALPRVPAVPGATSSATASAAAAPPRLYGGVRVNYPVRIGAHLAAGLLLGSVFAMHPPGGLWWVGVLMLVWPHLAYQLSLRAKDSKRSERQALLTDSLLIGMYGGLSGFNPWIIVSLGGAMNASNLGSGGWRHAWRGLVAMALGVVLGGALNGFAVRTETSQLTVALSAVAAALYLTLFGHAVYTASRRATKSRLALEERNREMQAQAEHLEQARQEAELANKAKSAFLANMSHELRTPLNAVIGYAELLEEELADSVPPEARADLGRIQHAAKELLGMINAVLDLTRLEAGKIQLHAEDCDLRGLLSAVEASAQPLLQANANRMQVLVQPGLALVHADAQRLRQVLAALVSNAAKFTHQGQVCLRVTTRAPQDGVLHMRFEIEDSGVGLSPAQIDSLFQPFLQVDEGSTRAFGGSGLGLAIGRRLCRLMGGDIEVRSTPGAGSCFTVWLPQPAHGPDPVASPDAPSDPLAERAA
ncbi:MAG TPA: ATP-binding protein [Pseudorhodoferax sp.]|nr:ATP-binding protein [Pseudorhodoferax sp.]